MKCPYAASFLYLILFSYRYNVMASTSKETASPDLTPLICSFSLNIP